MNPFAILRSSFALALLLAVGCDRPPDGDGHHLTHLPVWIGVPELTIGSLDGEVRFARVGDISLGPDGNLYVAESSPPQVRVFSLDGTPIRAIGGAGEGPGEFAAVSGLGWQGDTLQVWDSQLHRLSRFDLSGTFMDATDPQAPGGGPTFNPSTPLPDGTFLAVQSIPAYLMATGAVTRTPVLRINEQGEVLDTLYVRELANNAYGISTDGGTFYGSQPFSDAGFEAVQREERSVVLVDWTIEPEPAIAVTRRTFDGDTLFRTLVPYDPDPVTDGEVEEQVRDIAQRLRSGRFAGSESEARRHVRDALFVPPYHRPVSWVVSGPGGSAWVLLRRQESLEGEDPPFRWLVIDPDGRADRLVELPSHFNLRQVAQGEVWGVLRGEFDVPYVARLALRQNE